MKKNSLEIIPKQTERITNLPKGIFGDIYIAYIPGDSYNNVVSASKYVIDKGYRPVPHVPARNILNENPNWPKIRDAVTNTSTRVGAGNKAFEKVQKHMLNAARSKNLLPAN